MADLTKAEREVSEPTTIVGRGRPPGPGKRWWWAVLAGSGLAAFAAAATERAWHGAEAPLAPPPEPPQVTVSPPLQQTVQATGRFLGQFSAVDSVEVRAQVG